jgi:hypothetical protein
LIGLKISQRAGCDRIVNPRLVNFEKLALENGRLKNQMTLFPKSLTSLAVFGAVWAIVPVLRADDDHDDEPTSQPAVHVSLEREMEGMGRSYKIIRSQVSDASQNASTLQAVMELEQHTLAAKSVVPRAATTMPTAAENAEKLADFQALMLNVLRQELNLEEQLRANQNDKAAATVASLRDLETQGHHEFRRRRG